MGDCARLELLAGRIPNLVGFPQLAGDFADGGLAVQCHSERQKGRWTGPVETRLLSAPRLKAFNF